MCCVGLYLIPQSCVQPFLYTKLVQTALFSVMFLLIGCFLCNIPSPTFLRILTHIQILSHVSSFLSPLSLSQVNSPFFLVCHYILLMPTPQNLSHFIFFSYLCLVSSWAVNSTREGSMSCSSFFPFTYILPPWSLFPTLANKLAHNHSISTCKYPLVIISYCPCQIEVYGQMLILRRVYCP